MLWFCVISSNKSYCISYDFFNGEIGTEFLVLLKADSEKPSKPKLFSVCAEQCDLRLKIHVSVLSFWQCNLTVKKCPVFSALTVHCAGLCVSAPCGDITQTGVTRATFTHHSAMELDMQGTGDAVCMPNEISVPSFPSSALGSIDHCQWVSAGCPLKHSFSLLLSVQIATRAKTLFWLQWYLDSFLWKRGNKTH